LNRLLTSPQLVRFRAFCLATCFVNILRGKRLDSLRGRPARRSALRATRAENSASGCRKHAARCMGMNRNPTRLPEGEGGGRDQALSVTGGLMLRTSSDKPSARATAGPPIH